MSLPLATVKPAPKILPQQDRDQQIGIPVNTAELTILELADLYGWTMTGEQRRAEQEYIDKINNQYKTTHPMNIISYQCADGTAHPGDTIYRKGNGDRFTIQEDGTLKKVSNGDTIKHPDYRNFLLTSPKAGKMAAMRAAKKERKESAKPAQENRLVEAPCKQRTPVEAAKAASKAREMDRKEKESIIEKTIACQEKEGGCPVWQALDQIPVPKVLEHVDTADLVAELKRRGFTGTLSRKEEVQL